MQWLSCVKHITRRSTSQPSAAGRSQARAGVLNVSLYMDFFYIAVYGLYAALFVTPVAAALLRRPLSRYKSVFFGVVLFLLALVTTAGYFGISFSGVIADAVTYYLLYVLVGVALFQMYSFAQQKSVRTVLAIMMVPFLLLPALSALAFLAVLFVVGDYDPTYESKMMARYSCRVTSYGNATTPEGGYEVKMLSLWGIFEKEIYYQTTDIRQNQSTPEELCSSLALKLSS